MNKRHNALAFHQVRAAVASEILYFCHIDGKENPTDIMTKLLPFCEFWPFVKPMLFWIGDTKDAHVKQSTTQGECQIGTNIVPQKNKSVSVSGLKSQKSWIISLDPMAQIERANNVTKCDNDYVHVDKGVRHVDISVDVAATHLKNDSICVKKNSAQLVWKRVSLLVVCQIQKEWILMMWQFLSQSIG